MEYFHKITNSKEAAINFIYNELTKYKVCHGYNIPYAAAVAKNTTASPQDIAINARFNYAAFMKAISEFGFNSKDFISIYKTGKPLPNAEDVFHTKIKDESTVREFLQLVAKEHPHEKLGVSYTRWFINNTNANASTDRKMEPTSADWNSFSEYCKQTFNYTTRDLTSLSKDQRTEPDRSPIKTLFKQAAMTSEKKTLTYIDNFAREAVAHNYKSLATSYVQHMGRRALDSCANKIQADIMYNYKAWLEKVTDPNGPIKMTKPEVLSYFNECKAKVIAEAEGTNNI
jgi:hypothetical protein